MTVEFSRNTPKAVYRFTASEFIKINQEFAPEVKFKINDPLNLIYLKTEIQQPLLELTLNCIEQDAEQIKIDVRPGELRIEDDVQHSNANELAEKLNQKKVNTTKPIDTEYDFAWGGCGIWSTRKALKKIGGKLTYHATENNRIIAVATWTN